MLGEFFFAKMIICHIKGFKARKKNINAQQWPVNKILIFSIL